MNLYWTLAVIIFSFSSSWEIHTWYDGYKGEHQAIVAEHKAAAGETKIIKDTQNLQKDLKHDKPKDNCYDEYIPSPVLKQL